ncbi:N-acyl homoserine lactonase family protein [Streptomyces virginiae]
MPEEGLLHGASGVISVPSTVAVIEHAVHGLILFDTGINHRVADPKAADSYWGVGLRAAYGAQAFTREHAIDAQLDRLGYRLSDVKYVIYSHLHLDHAGGMSYFPEAVHVVQHDELAGDTDLFLDGTVTVVRTAGHTPGHQGIILNLAHQERIAFMGDAAHLQEGLDGNVPMTSDWNIQEKLLTYGRLRQLGRAGVRTFLSHDPGHFAALPHDGVFWD